MTKLKTIMLAASAAVALASCTQQKVETPSTKTLVLFYSQTGATRAVAEELQLRLGADIDSIVAEEPYSGTFEETIARCQEEMAADILPSLKALNADIDSYDTIFLGYPVWFGTFARPMKAYLAATKLDGKVIVPFCTFGSGGLEATEEELKAALPDAEVRGGYGVRNARIAAMPQELDRFLKENQYIDGEIMPQVLYGEQKPVTDAEKAIFDEACGNYQFPLGTPQAFRSRTTDEGVDYMFDVISQDRDGNESSSVIYVTVQEGAMPEFTKVVR